jgi:hypothetical protein
MALLLIIFTLVKGHYSASIRCITDPLSRINIVYEIRFLIFESSNLKYITFVSI